MSGKDSVFLMRFQKHGRRMAVRLLSVLLIGLLVSCQHSGAGTQTGTETQQAAPPPATEWPLIEDGESTYTIYADYTNADERQYAMALQLRLYTLCGAMLPLKNAAEENVQGAAILVGNTGTDESTALLSTLGERDFCYRISETGNLLLAATDAEMYLKLDLILEEQLFSSVQEQTLMLPASGGFLYSVDCPDGVFGSEAEILSGGESEYVLIYDIDGTTSRSAANAVADYLEAVCGVRFAVKSDNSVNQKEILLGPVARSAATDVAGRLNASGEYGIWVSGSTLALAGYDEIDIARAVERFAGMLAGSGGDLTLHQSDNLLSAYEVDPYEGDLRACVSLYHEMYGTYGSYAEMRYATMSEADRADQALIEALIDRMGNSVAFYVGSSTALWRGFYVKLNTEDYSQVTLNRGGRLLIAGEFAAEYLGPTAVPDADGYVDLTGWCERNSGWELHWDGNLAVLTPPGEQSFADANETVGAYTNAAYLDKMQELFTDPTRREPENKTEQTRVVVAEAHYDPSVVWDYTEISYRTNYSPGICAVTENGAEVLYVSYESCLVQNFQTETENVTYLLRSTDGGKTWTTVGSVDGMRWACIFECNQTVYLLGTHVVGSDAMVARYQPETGSFTWANLGVIGGVGAPCTVLIANERIYKASGDRIMSASVHDDLLLAESWRFSSNSAQQLLPKSWFLSASGVGDFDFYALGEGSVVLGPDGGIYMLLRIDCDPYCGYAAIVQVSDDGSTLAVVETCNSLIRMPTSVSKFSVRYDAETGLYLTMISLPTLETGAARQRNILVLAASRDLLHWTVVDTLLVDREMMNRTLSAAAHGFQYVDFVISGDCLRMVVREATGVTNSYHDGKYITLYTVEDFRALIGEQCPELLEGSRNG